jgi:hypothetical protein
MEPRTPHEQEIMRKMGELLTERGFEVITRGGDSNVFQHPGTKQWVKVTRTGSLFDPIVAEVARAGEPLLAWNRKGLGIVLNKVAA